MSQPALDHHSILYLDPPRLARGLQAGMAQLIESGDYLNKINVFPVPDGDTGTNMASTARAIFQTVSKNSGKRLPQFCRQLADTAVEESRGNSGAILAQFFQGFSEGVGELRRLSYHEFVSAFGQGVAAAKQALAQPKRGTILTVMETISEKFEALRAAGERDYAQALIATQQTASQALKATTEQLAELRAAKVVDAGAMGFVEILSGVLDLIRTGENKSLNLDLADVAQRAIEPELGHMERPEHRYCTECIISGDSIDRQALNLAITEFASSVVVAGSPRKVRVHAHVDQPAMLFELCTQYGVISQHKADDMLQQQQSAHKRVGSFAVITDSGADLSDELRVEHNIHIASLRIMFGAEEFMDKVSISPKLFYDRLQSSATPPSTSQPPVGDFKRHYRFLSAHYPEILSLHIGRLMSGTLQAAESAAADINEARIQTLDTANASVGVGLLALNAAEAAAAGLTLDAARDYVESLVPHTYTLAVIEDLSYAVRGGRVPAIIKRVADLLRVTIVIGNRDGRVTRCGVILGRSNIPQRFARLIRRRFKRDASLRFNISHGVNRADAEQVRDRLLSYFSAVDACHLCDTGATIGTHAGPESIVVGIQEWQPVPAASN